MALLWIQSYCTCCSAARNACMLCNVQFHSTSAGYSGQDLMNHREKCGSLSVTAADGGACDATFGVGGLGRVQSR